MAEISNSPAFTGEEANGFVALDIGNLPNAADKDSNANSSPRITKSFSRKGSQKLEGDGATAFSITCGPQKPAASGHVPRADESVSLSRAFPPTANGWKCRRLGSRRTPWLDPRRVLLGFAALSSMGTLILLYFTLSMGKISGGDADAR